MSKDAVRPESEPVCWLDRVCAACGALSDEEHPIVCARCGASEFGE